MASFKFKRVDKSQIVAAILSVVMTAALIVASAPTEPRKFEKIMCTVE